MNRILTLSFLQNLLRLALQEFNKLEGDNHSPAYQDVHRAFVTVSQKLDVEVNRRAPQAQVSR